MKAEITPRDQVTSSRGSLNHDREKRSPVISSAVASAQYILCVFAYTVRAQRRVVRIKSHYRKLDLQFARQRQRKRDQL